MSAQHWWISWMIALVAAGCGGCGGDPGQERDAEGALLMASAGPDGTEMPPGAMPELVESLRQSLATEPHPSDGGGRAWLEQLPGDPEFAIAGAPGRFRLIYEVGPEGIAVGGMIYFQVSPFWHWSTPQVEEPELDGFTKVTASGKDIQVDAATLDQQLLVLRVSGRALRAGDQITFVYGAGPAGALADSLAEKNSRFWFAIDGDGDGFRVFLKASPGIDVLSAPPTQIRVTLPSVARPGKPFRITVATLDPSANAGYPFEGRIELTSTSAEHPLELTEPVVFVASDRGRKTFEAIVREPGVVRVRAKSENGIVGESNPMMVSSDGQNIFWGDLHGHTSLSDGTGTVADYFLYARDASALDVVAITDHDHWGVLQLDQHPEFWEETKAETRRFHQPGRFVTLLGYEWTSWIYGHRHVLYFEDEGEIYSSISPDYEHPTQLWDALRGKPALTFAHHSAGGVIRTDWDVPPDPILEPLTEITSVHGSSEALDSPVPIYDPIPGNFVRDVLDRDYRFGFVGSGDSHDGHPGLAHLVTESGGLAAIVADTLTRESVLEAMRARRVYATNGPRILLRTALDEHPMGALIPKPDAGSYSGELFVKVVAEAPLERLDLIRSGQVVDSLPIDGLLEITLRREIEDLVSGEYLYVRAVQVDTGTAWSSPIYIE
ncbi:MAG: CehA/McbA family metallohydrolase [Deltaproteobacteria bacterium]|nr:CehA/McbA family metallohydrolase [Deltaproteobacteria bacterium]